MASTGAGSSGEERFPSLDLSTQLGGRPDDEGEQGWRFTSWPECSEASLAWVTSGSGCDGRKVARQLRAERLAEEEMPREPPRAEELWEADAQALTWAQANGRASAKSRRYFVRNALRYMWVLTYATSRRERRAVMSEVSEFARRVRSALGTGFPYWYSPELHPGGHGWHVNFFVPQRIKHSLVENVWGEGFVWVTDFVQGRHGPKGEPLGLCATPREGWRRAARYGCKYAQKDWSAEHVGRDNHRYEVAQGYGPKSVGFWVQGKAHADELISQIVTPGERKYLQVWDSADAVEWPRPPVRTWRW